MKDYTKVKFKGTFRHYQQSVLDNADYFMRNGKIHIVAAPGSGKTTLGLELIRILNQPALILSPSITIRGQWGNRFDDGFLDSNEDVNEYLSYNLKETRLLTSITYQGLHSAFNKLIDKDISDNDTEENEIIIDYSDFELIKKLKSTGIKTICLDEAHHLRSEWYNTLIKVIESLGEDIIIIALTATPPYDSTPQEWEKYINLCGVIDEEIFVPELIQKNNLCPHQDFIYFNYPTQEEQDLLNHYQITVSNTLNEIFSSSIFEELLYDFMDNYEHEKYKLYENIEYYISLGTIISKLQIRLPRKLKSILKGRNRLEKGKVKYIEQLFEFIIKEPDIFGEDKSSYLKDILYTNGLIERRKVYLNKSTELKKKVISSIGKLDSIAEIAKFESENLKQDLKMLILTDYIKKDQLYLIGSNENIITMGAVPIFEKVRRNVDASVRTCLLSGSLVIYPNEILEVLTELCENRNISYIKTSILDTPYSIIDFKSNNKQKVDIITEIFENGYIDIIIGTKSLLGEGWDSPSINTLILASFVGSYMLSNQMRGRAIRIDQKTPNKVANIWHLATVESNKVVGSSIDKISIVNYILEDKTIVSADYTMLDRRFDAFLGPAFIENYVSSGIERIDYIKPPFNQKRFKEFNEITLSKAKERGSTRDKWNYVLSGDETPEILDQSEIVDNAVPYGIIIIDVSIFVSFTAIVSQLSIRLSQLSSESSFALFLLALILLLSAYVYSVLLPRLVLNAGPKARINNQAKILLKTLKDIGEVESEDAMVTSKRDRRCGFVYTSLSNATRHEKAVFTSSIKEMLSEIDNPRYLIIRKYNFFGTEILSYSESYSVPKVIGTNKEYANTLQMNMLRTKGKYKVVYTRSEYGRKILLKCQRRSNTSQVSSFVLSRRIVDKDQSKTSQEKT